VYVHVDGRLDLWACDEWVYLFSGGVSMQNIGGCSAQLLVAIV